MTRRQKLRGRREKTRPPKAKPAPPKQTEAWAQHEQVAPSVQDQAQKLLDEAGSPELAKHAVEQAARAQADEEQSR